MAHFVCNSIDDFNKLFRTHMRERTTRIKKAVRRTATQGKRVMSRNMPIAFRVLLGSLEVDPLPNGGSRVGSSAPHAEGTEIGTRPHYPPIGPLIKWVKLRGMQGNLSLRQLKKLPGTTTHRHALTIAAQLRMMENKRRGVGVSLNVDAPTRIAYAIQQAIGKNGTKPHFWARKSLPEIMTILDAEVSAALPDP